MRFKIYIFVPKMPGIRILCIHPPAYISISKINNYNLKFS